MSRTVWFASGAMAALVLTLGGSTAAASEEAVAFPGEYNVVWTIQSKNAGESMPVAGGKVYEEQLDWSWLILQYHQFSGGDITRYLRFIEQSVIFYDEHYR